MRSEYEYIKRADIMEALTSADMQRTIKTGDGAEAYRKFMDIVLSTKTIDVQVVSEVMGTEIWLVREREAANA